MSVIALETIRHNGEVFEAGEVLEKLSKKDETRLIKIGSAKKQITPKKQDDK